MIQTRKAIYIGWRALDTGKKEWNIMGSGLDRISARRFLDIGLGWDSVKQLKILDIGIRTCHLVDG